MTVSPDLAAICEAVAILAPHRYSILGDVRECPDAAPHEATPNLVRFLEGEMYQRLYTRSIPVPPAGLDVVAQRDHLGRLSAANTGTGAWEPGWRIVGHESDGRFAVARDDITFYVTRDEIRTRAGRPRAGAFCRVRVAKEIRHLIPGFYMAVGNGDARQKDEPGALVRVYWNLTTAAAAEYMALVTGSLNARRLPFRTKVLSDPGAYVRADAGVLYVERRLFGRVCPVIVEVLDALRGALRPEVPMLTKKLADGVGLAEDPPGGMSFGQSRMSVIAHALWSAFLSGRTSPAAKVEAVASAFAANGLDPERPYLSSGGRDVYTLERAGARTG